VTAVDVVSSQASRSGRHYARDASRQFFLTTLPALALPTATPYGGSVAFSTEEASLLKSDSSLLPARLSCPLAQVVSLLFVLASQIYYIMSFYIAKRARLVEAVPRVVRWSVPCVTGWLACSTRLVISPPFEFECCGGELALSSQPMHHGSPPHLHMPWCWSLLV
jgi:hypothetical protein